MTKEELKHRLRSYQDLKAESDQVSDLLAEVEAKMKFPSGSVSDGLPRGSGGGDPMFGIVARHIDLEKRYKSIQAKLAAAQCEIEELIDCLEPRERKLMRHYYIEGLTWEKVCVAMNYSWRQVHNIHRYALNRILELHEGKSA